MHTFLGLALCFMILFLGIGGDLSIFHYPELWVPLVVFAVAMGMAMKKGLDREQK